MGGWGDKDHEEDAGDDHTNQDHEYPNNQDDQEDQEWVATAQFIDSQPEKTMETEAQQKSQLARARKNNARSRGS